MPAAGLAVLIGAPFAIGVGGIAVAAFALGPALLNTKIRNMGNDLPLTEAETIATDERPAPSPATGDS